MSAEPLCSSSVPLVRPCAKARTHLIRGGDRVGNVTLEARQIPVVHVEMRGLMVREVLRVATASPRPTHIQPTTQPALCQAHAPVQLPVHRFKHHPLAPQVVNLLAQLLVVGDSLEDHEEHKKRQLGRWMDAAGLACSLRYSYPSQTPPPPPARTPTSLNLMYCFSNRFSRMVICFCSPTAFSRALLMPPMVALLLPRVPFMRSVCCCTISTLRFCSWIWG